MFFFLFAQARYYLPETGRFISEDSYKGTLPDIQSQNRYIYCTNNPLKYIDPSGHFGKKSQSWIQKGFGDIGSLLNSGSGEFIDGDIDEIESLRLTTQQTHLRANEIVGNIEEYSKDQAVEAGLWAAGTKVFTSIVSTGVKVRSGFKSFKFWRRNKKIIKTEAKLAAKTETEIMEEFDAKIRANKKKKYELEVNKKKTETGKPNGKTSCKEIFKNGKLDYESLKNNKSSFKGKSTDEIANMLEEAGYKTEIKKSTKSKSGAEIIQIKNSGGDRNITQVQVSPGGGRHGVNPYIKISTSDQGIIKIIDGPKSLYKTDGLETAKIIFLGGN